ncbi:MAG: DUF2357 domain-containing protein [Oscillospiraceae bacterium]
MAGTINDLYLKYCNRVQRSLETDRYYEYLLGLISSGKTVIHQNNRTLNKEVDETWLTAIEEVIPSLHEIIAHPKRFIKTEENLVPIELVKKVSSESVRHLCQNTQNISGIKGGMIIPGKILSVENQESFDLYENRFINTLIRKLYAFIEKRTDILFWETGDEHASALSMESTVEDDYETIEYKLEMVVKSKQTYIENDTDKMEVFKRIDRVHRIIGDFRQSSFVQLMQDSAPVRSPIQRTNQIVKNPDYKKCYALWQFLEQYDQVGYEINVKENALEFDEDYLYQMYGNIALNYTVFKSIMEADPRKITAETKQKRTIKPKFMKQIVEEFVDNYDIPDVEIRQVIIEEVTKAQLEIERRQKELDAEKAAKAAQHAKEAAEKKAKADAEKAVLLAKKQKEQASQKERIAREKELAKIKAQREKAKLLAAERAKKEKEQAQLKAQKLRDAEKAKAQKLRDAEKAKALAAKEKEKERLKAQKAKALAAEKAKLAAAKEKEKKKLLAEKAKEKLLADKEKERLSKKPATEKVSKKNTDEKTVQKTTTAKKPVAEKLIAAPVGVAEPAEPVAEPVMKPIAEATVNPAVETAAALVNTAEKPVIEASEESVVETPAAPITQPVSAPKAPESPAEPEATTGLQGWLARLRHRGK